MKTNFDIYEWIFSIDVREHVRSLGSMSVLNKAALVVSSTYFSVEEKISALKLLLQEAQTETEKELLQRKLHFYQAGLEWISNPGSEYNFFLECTWDDDEQKNYKPWDETSFPNKVLGILDTLDELMDYVADPYDFIPEVKNFYAIIQERADEYTTLGIGTWHYRLPVPVSGKSFIRLEEVDDHFLITDFFFHDLLQEKTGIHDINIPFNCHTLPHLHSMNELLPYQTGDLVILHTPAFSESVGVIFLNNDIAWLGFIYHGEFQILSAPAITEHGYRLIDWTWKYQTFYKELPEEHKVLSKISKYITELYAENQVQAFQIFQDIFHSGHYNPKDFEKELPIPECLQVIQQEKSLLIEHICQEERQHLTTAVFSKDATQYAQILKCKAEQKNENNTNPSKKVIIDEENLEKAVQRIRIHPDYAPLYPPYVCENNNLEKVLSHCLDSFSEFYVEEIMEMDPWDIIYDIDADFDLYSKLYQNFGELQPEDHVWFTNEVQKDGTLHKILHVEVTDHKIKPIVLAYYEHCISNTKKEERWKWLELFKQDMRIIENVMKSWAEKALNKVFAELIVWEDDI